MNARISMFFRHLRSFCVVAEEGHVTRAAKRLNMAQPGLTQHIRALEDLIGVELVQRVGRGIELTPSGRLLHEEAEGLLEHVHTVLDKTREVAGVRKRHIEVGITGVVSLEPAVTKRLQSFRQAHPGVVVRDVVLEAEEAIRLLKQRQLDVVFSCGTLPKETAIRKRVLGPIETALAVSRLHRLANERHKALRELCSETLIVVSPCPSAAIIKDRMRRLCKKQGVVPHDLQVTSDLFSALCQVSSNTGVAIVPRSIQTLKTDAVQYLSLTDMPQSLLTLALYVRQGEQNQHVLDFSDLP